MKHKLLKYAIGILPLLLFSIVVSAQDTTYKSLPPITITPATKVPSAVKETFNSSFENAVNPEWYKLDTKYLVTFLTRDQKNRALYDKNGELIYHIRYGFEQNLPNDIRSMVKSNYNNYTITMAIAVNQNLRNIWVINMENKDRYIIVRVEDGEMEEVQNLVRTM